MKGRWHVKICTLQSSSQVQPLSGSGVIVGKKLYYCLGDSLPPFVCCVCPESSLGYLLISVHVNFGDRTFPITYFLGGHMSSLWDHWYPCFGLLVTSPLGFKTRVGSPIRTWQRHTWCRLPEIRLWCNTCRPLGGQHDSRSPSPHYIIIRICSCVYGLILEVANLPIQWPLVELILNFKKKLCKHRPSRKQKAKQRLPLSCD